MGIPAKRVFRFERFCLDLGRGALSSGGSEISLRPKSFEVLCHLTMNAGRLVSKQEFDDAVWPNVAVTDASLSQCIRELREKLGDTSRTLIKTVHRRGYMLDTTVSEDACGDVMAAAALPADSEHKPIAADERPDDEIDRANENKDVTGSAAVIAAAAPPDEAGLVQTGERLQRAGRRSARLALLAGAMSALIVVAGAAAWFAGFAPLRGPWGAHAAQPLSMFRDCGACPEMVVLPAAEFGTDNHAEAGKRRAAARTIAVGRFEVTVEEFAAFVDQTGHDVGQQCNVVTGSGKSVSLSVPTDADFRRQPDKTVTGRHPAGCVNWHDAKAYVVWLAQKTGKPYRLLTGAEWEYAARAGTSGPYSFDGGIGKLCEYARFADLDSQFPWGAGCHSEIVERGALPVGSLKPNPWGLFDVHGNLWELVEDCISSDPAILHGADDKATEGCQVAVARGGGWAAAGRRVDAGFRLDVRTRFRNQPIGFRVGLTIDP
jgi:formylglycine-generating enzyme required for sulfatase activity